jgi:hypothetical protein
MTKYTRENKLQKLRALFGECALDPHVVDHRYEPEFSANVPSNHRFDSTLIPNSNRSIPSPIARASDTLLEYSIFKDGNGHDFLEEANLPGNGSGEGAMSMSTFLYEITKSDPFMWKRFYLYGEG